MAHIVHEELFVHTSPPGLIAVTTNSIVKSDGGLVMGRGSAGEIARLVPEIRFEGVRAIKRAWPNMKLDGTQDYGFIVVRMPTEKSTGIGFLQAKRNWMDTSSRQTIVTGLDMLSEWASQRPDIQIRSVIPGWGCGQIGRGERLDKDELLALCGALPDNVKFCIRRSDVT